MILLPDNLSWRNSGAIGTRKRQFHCATFYCAAIRKRASGAMLAPPLTPFSRLSWRNSGAIDFLCGYLPVMGGGMLMSANPWLKYHRQASVKTATAGGTPAPTDPIATVNRAPPAGVTAVTRPFSRAAVNRLAMPTVAAAVDQLRAVFETDQVQIVYACENGRELGREPPPGVIAHPLHVPHKSRLSTR